MSDETLRMVETKGLVGAVEAADAMTKATNVALIGYKKIGSGLVTTMIRRDVGTVKASVDANAAATTNADQVVSQHVISRPYTDIEKILLKSLWDASKYISASVAGIQTSGRG